MEPGARNPLSSRLVLALGFGGLLALMGLAGFDAFQALRQIQAANDRIREEFLSRNRALHEIRSDLYLSGTYVRDYLLEPEASDAEARRQSLVRVRGEMDVAVAAYRRLLGPVEKAPFEALTRELAGYWRVLEPPFHWNPEERARRAYPFLRDEVFPRRMAMLRVADQIDEINESQLGAGKALVARTYAQSRTRLVGTLGLTFGLGLVLAYFSVRAFLDLEREAALRYSEVANARGELKLLSARLVAAQEDERRNISRELHDEVGQALSAVLVELGNVSTARRAGNPAALAGHLESVKSLVENSVAVVRNMALLLRPSMLDDLGLVPALQWQAREVSKRMGIRVKVAAEDVSDELPEEHKTCIYRVVQEALNNAASHAAAQVVRVNVKQEPRRIVLQVADDGKGFEPQARGMGLLGVEERVTNLGGRFEIRSAPGRGTSLEIVLPLIEEAAPKAVPEAS